MFLLLAFSSSSRGGSVSCNVILNIQLLSQIVLFIIDIFILLVFEMLTFNIKVPWKSYGSPYFNFENCYSHS